MEISRGGPAPALLCADWGRRPRKRAAREARPGRGCAIRRAEPPAGGWSLAALLARARVLRDRWRAPVLLGIDAVLGVPAAFARAAGAAGFLDALGRLERGGGLAGESASAAAWTPQRPFFRVPPGRGGLGGFVAAAGGRDVLLRRIERATGAKSVFVLSGIPGSVGSGSRALWCELAPLLRAADRDFRVWPFEGGLAGLMAREQVVLAEIYPRAAYAAALAPELPARPLRLAKTREPVRADALRRLEAAAWVKRLGVELPDLDEAHRNEDDFDALLSTAALVRLCAEGRPLVGAEVDADAEGGILATGGAILREAGGDARRC